MTDVELDRALLQLELSPTEAAQLLGVTPRTVRRWFDGEDVPGPAEQAIRAWLRLHERNLPWRPDSVSIVQDDQEQIARQRAHAIDLSGLLARVEARGGARLPWEVDLIKRRAVLGPMQVSYYKLRNNSFSLAFYTRKDGTPDVRRDWEFIEDAAYAIAEALKREPEFGPVTLVYHDGPALGRVAAQELEQFDSNEAAIHRACALMSHPKSNGAFIMERGAKSKVLWDPRQLKQECERRKAART